MKAIHHVVASFDVDHRTLKKGVYLRSEKFMTKSWDIRLVAPSEKKPLSPGAMHVIEHVFATYMRMIDGIGERIIAVCPMGCLTGLYVITTSSVSMSDIVFSIQKMIKDVFPLNGIDDVPGMNEIQCGNPLLNDIDGANQAMIDFMS